MEFEELNSFFLNNSERLILGDLIYSRIKGAIANQEDSATLFMMFPVAEETNPQGVVFKLDKDQFSIFLDKYLGICETEELYELCSEIQDLRKKI